jgi:hypothetical protein
MLEEVVPPGDEGQLVDLVDPLPSLLTFSLHPMPGHAHSSLYFLLHVPVLLHYQKAGDKLFLKHVKTLNTELSALKANRVFCPHNLVQFGFRS